MAHKYPTLHPHYGSNAVFNHDAGDYCYRVTGSDTHVMFVESAIIAGHTVDEIVADPELECQNARRAVAAIYEIWHTRLAPGGKVAA